MEEEMPTKRVMLGVQEFRRYLSDLIKTLENGEHIILTKRGKPAAVMVPIAWYRTAAEAVNDPTEY